MIKLADTLAPMADFPAVEAKDVAFNDNKSLQEKYDNGELGGGSGSGEENKIDSISINGSPITPDENKNVDITVPDAYDDTALVQRISDIESDYAKSSDIPSLSGYATETWVNEQGCLTEHLDLSAYATKEEIPTVPSKVRELTNDSNYQSAEQVSITVTTEIAKVVADAPEDFDTLTEMSDWIAGHENDASAMNSAITDNKTNIETLQTDVSNITTSLDNKVDKTELEDIQASGVKISKSDGTKKSLQGMYEDGELGGGVEIDDSKSSSDTTYSSSKIVELTSKYAMSFNSSTGKLSITLK